MLENKPHLDLTVDVKQKDTGMDAVDEKQQRQIDRLQHVIIFLVSLGMLLVLFAAIFAGNREIQCPHSDCPHFIGTTQ